jgi:BMFP domain-containing protein YqiC
MIDPKSIDDLAKRFADAMPSGIKQLQADMDKNFHAMLQAAFAKMDLVTREEFDVQHGVLARTRAKLEALERQVAELEERVSAQPPVAASTGARKPRARKKAAE